jgi:DNA-binding transcriptional MerR regulator
MAVNPRCVTSWKKKALIYKETKPPIMNYRYWHFQDLEFIQLPEGVKDLPSQRQGNG